MFDKRQPINQERNGSNRTSSVQTPTALISFRAKLHIVNAYFQNLFPNVCCREMIDQVFFSSFWTEAVLEMLNNEEKQRVQVSRRGLLPHVGARMIRL